MAEEERLKLENEYRYLKNLLSQHNSNTSAKSFQPKYSQNTFQWNRAPHNAGNIGYNKNPTSATYKLAKQRSSNPVLTNNPNTCVRQTTGKHGNRVWVKDAHTSHSSVKPKAIQALESEPTEKNTQLNQKSLSTTVTSTVLVSQTKLTDKITQSNVQQETYADLNKKCEIQKPLHVAHNLSYHGVTLGGHSSQKQANSGSDKLIRVSSADTLSHRTQKMNSQLGTGNQFSSPENSQIFLNQFTVKDGANLIFDTSTPKSHQTILDSGIPFESHFSPVTYHSKVDDSVSPYKKVNKFKKPAMTHTAPPVFKLAGSKNKLASQRSRKTKLRVPGKQAAKQPVKNKYKLVNKHNSIDSAVINSSQATASVTDSAFKKSRKGSKSSRKRTHSSSSGYKTMVSKYKFIRKRNTSGSGSSQGNAACITSNVKKSSHASKYKLSRINSSENEKPEPKKFIFPVAQQQKTVVHKRYKLVRKSLPSVCRTAAFHKLQATQQRNKLVRKAIELSWRAARDRSSVVHYTRSRGAAMNSSPYKLDRSGTRQNSSWLGRSSKNKYRLVRNSSVKKSKLPPRTKLKVDRRRVNQIMIRPYIGSQMKWTKGFPGHAVKKVHPGTPSTYKFTSKLFAQKAIQRSIAQVRAANKNKRSAQYCTYYNRFGRCSRGTKCQFIHDPQRVAICTRFLRGTCEVDGCPFSHTVSMEKMPTCRFFLRGVCFREKCPYLHVNVGRSAKACPQFALGFCPRADKCTMKHAVEPKQTKSRKVAPERKKQEPKSDVVENKLLHIDDTEDDLDLPLKDRKLPQFIALSSGVSPAVKEQQDLSQSSIQSKPKTSDKPKLQIRPNFL